MSNKKIIWFVIPFLAIMYSCDKTGTSGSGASLPLTSLVDSVSYAIGMDMGENIKSSQSQYGEEFFNADLLMNGFREGMAGESRIPKTEVQNVMMQFQKMLSSQAGKKNREEGAAFLAENATKEGVKTTASGLQYIVNQEGTGASPTATDKVEVHYEGTLLNGDVFDSSIKRGKPIQFALNGVIPGWTEGLQLMKEGSKYTFFIPSNLAYGERGSGQQIGPDATLKFDVELLRVNPPAEAK